MTPRSALTVMAVAGGMFVLGYLTGRGAAGAPKPAMSVKEDQPGSLRDSSGLPPTMPQRLPDAADRAKGARHRSAIESLLTDGAPPTPLTPEEIASYVQLNNADAQSLLAAFETSQDIQWLQQAAEAHPDDPRVMFAVINFGDDSIPGDRLDWIGKLSQAAPDNALADYLSAAELLKRGKPDEAIRSLLGAQGKTTFDDYTIHTLQAAEEMHTRAGRSPAEAKATAGIQTRLPHLKELRDLGRGMAMLYGERVAAGNTQSADSIAAAGLNMGRHMSVGSGNRYLLNELVGIATEKIFLDALDPNQEHAFLDRPTAELQQELQKQRDNIKALAGRFNPETMSDADVIAYFDRVKLYGEYETLKWLYNRSTGQ